jgi:hypothetical protein
MDYNKTTISIGKIKSYDQATGEIVSQEGIFLFTKEDISDEELININDMVLFRGEEIQGQKKAFFIRKLNPTKDLNNQVYTKTKSIKFLKEND